MNIHVIVSWLYFSLFRTVSWGQFLDGSKKNHNVRSLMQNFLDDPNLLMLLVNGHHNVSTLSTFRNHKLSLLKSHFACVANTVCEGVPPQGR
jgi:hypothetical protein